MGTRRQKLQNYSWLKHRWHIHRKRNQWSVFKEKDKIVSLRIIFWIKINFIAKYYFWD